MANQTIYNPGYVAELRGQVNTTGAGMQQAFDALKAKYGEHGGQWEDAGSTGPSTTFGILIEEFQGVMSNFLTNLETTSSNVQGYEAAMSDVATTFNFAASS